MRVTTRQISCSVTRREGMFVQHTLSWYNTKHCVRNFREILKQDGCSHHQQRKWSNMTGKRKVKQGRQQRNRDMLWLEMRWLEKEKMKKHAVDVGMKLWWWNETSSITDIYTKVSWKGTNIITSIWIISMSSCLSILLTETKSREEDMCQETQGIILQSSSSLTHLDFNSFNCRDEIRCETDLLYFLSLWFPGDWVRKVVDMRGLYII